MNLMRFLCFAAPVFGIFFWNLENFFDNLDGGSNASDKEFSARGERHWTRRRFDAKACLVGKTLLWSGSPAVAGVCEVENSLVLRRLLGSDILRKCGYSYVHFDSPDPRGIDVALLYDKTIFSLISARPVGIPGLRTRDILYAELEETTSGEHWHFLVNHHPSKYGGISSADRRLTAMKTLAACLDSLNAAGCRNIVAMGDFNDIPTGEAFSLLSEPFHNLGITLAGAGEGSIRYRGKWQLIDNFIVSGDVAAKMEMRVLRPAFLLERDRQWPGDKPRRTFIGPRYNAGASDHLPVMLTPR